MPTQRSDTPQSIAPPGTAAIVSAYMLARRTSLAEETARMYAVRFAMLAERFPAMPVEPEPIEAWLADYAETHASSTTRGLYQTTRLLYEWAERRYGIPNPMWLVTPPRKGYKLPVMLTNDEARTILEHAQTPTEMALGLLILGTGVRIGEAASIRAEDIGPTTIVVNGKTGERLVPNPHPAFCELTRLVARGGWLFPSSDNEGEPLQAHSLIATWRRMTERIGIYGRKGGPHAARHWVGAQTYLKTGDIELVRQLLGHSEPKSTTVYVRATAARLPGRFAAVSPLRDVVQFPTGTPEPEPAPPIALPSLRELILRWTRGRATFIGRDTLDILADKKPHRAAEIAAEQARKSSTVLAHLHYLITTGVVERVGPGWYQLAGGPVPAERLTWSRGDVRRDILRVLAQETALTPARVAERLNRNRSGINRLMWGMAREGELVAYGEGVYGLPNAHPTAILRAQLERRRLRREHAHRGGAATQEAAEARR